MKEMRDHRAHRRNKRTRVSRAGQFARSSAPLVLISLACSFFVPPAISSAQGPTTELAAVQAEAEGLRQQIAETERSLAAAEKAAEPEGQAAKDADAAADRAEEEVAELSIDLGNLWDEAAADIEAAEQAYDDEKADAEETRTGAFGAGGLAVLIALVAYGLSRWKGWTLPRWANIAGGAVLAVMFVGGIVPGIASSSPDEPEFSEETLTLAALAGESPEDNPTPELRAALEKAQPLALARAKAAKELETALRPFEQYQDELSSLKKDLKPLAAKEADLQHEVDLAEQEAAEEAEFRAAATTVDYDELIKDPSDYKGTKVVYTGQIFQIQEVGSRSIILLSVTKEFGNFWDDHIWIDAGEIASAEDDIITVYGTVTGSKSYQTQIGGSTFVPRMKAAYIDE